MIIVKNGFIYTMKGKNINNGYVVIEGAKIKDVKEGNPVGYGENIHTIDANGGCILPGFIDAHSHRY